MRNTRPQNSIPHSTMGEAELCQLCRICKLHSAGSRFELPTTDCGVSGQEEEASGCCVDLESFPLKRAGEALEGKAAVKVSAVWQRDPSSNCVSTVFLKPGRLYYQKLWGRWQTVSTSLFPFIWMAPQLECFHLQMHALFDNLLLSATFASEGF